MMRPSMFFLSGCLIGLTLTPGLAQGGDPSQIRALTAQATDQGLAWTDRVRAFSSLEAADIDTARDVAKTLITDKNRSLQIQGGWLLADTGDPEGLAVLRTNASEHTEESVIAISMLGRLRDSESHDALRNQLDHLLQARDDSLAPGIVLALIEALGDYADPRDGDILVRALGSRNEAGGWITVEAMGRTASPEVVPTLRRLFSTGTGATAWAAGLGLARCGDATGHDYLRRLWQLDTKSTASTKDDRYTENAGKFALQHLGVPADSVIAPLVALILKNPTSPYYAAAWDALPRLATGNLTSELLSLAWQHLEFEGAGKFIVQHDEASARKFLAQTLTTGTAQSGTYGRFVLRIATQTSERDRRRWKESHAYTFH